MSTVSPFSGDRWSVPPPLSPSAKRIFQQRKDFANRRLSETQAGTRQQAGEAEAQNLFDIKRLREDVAARMRSGLSEAASRGLAYNPMFAGRLQREASKFQSREEAQQTMNLTNRLNELERSLTQAVLARDEEFLRIAQEEAAQKMALQMALAAGGA
jgi:hypothetical protein